MSKWAATPSTWQEPETGNTPAICIRVIDLGTQKKEYQGKESWRRQSMLIWEIPGQLDGEGKPLTISKFYTASLSEKANLRHDLENWRGRPFTPEELNGFDQKNVIGKPCLLNLIRNEKGKVIVGSVNAVVKGMAPLGSPVHDTYVYSIDEHDNAIWEKLSDGIKAMIMKSREKSGSPAPSPSQASTEPEWGPPPTDDDDIVPF